MWTFHYRTCLSLSFPPSLSLFHCLSQLIAFSSGPLKPTTLVPTPPIQLPAGSQWEAWKWVSDYQFPGCLAASWTADGCCPLSWSKDTWWSQTHHTKPQIPSDHFLSHSGLQFVMQRAWVCLCSGFWITSVGLPWNFVQTFVLPRAWRLVSWLFIQHHHQMRVRLLVCTNPGSGSKQARLWPRLKQCKVQSKCLCSFHFHPVCWCQVHHWLIAFLRQKKVIAWLISKLVCSHWRSASLF